MIEGRSINDSLRQLARDCYRRWGEFAYAAFDRINKEYFESALPTPLILWEITPWGHCIAQNRTPTKNPTGPVVVLLHPGLLGGRLNPITTPKEEGPWGLPRWAHGWPFAYDTLLHECIHININVHLGGHKGDESHNCPQWIDEVNRLAPMLGLQGVEAGRSKTRRVPIEGEYTKTGKPATRVVRRSDGTLTRKEVASFPNSVRMIQQPEFYTQPAGPFVEGIIGNS